MGAFQVRLLAAAARDLSRLDRPSAQRVVKRLNWLASNYDSTQPEPLSGDLVGFNKLRVGDIRVIYETLNEEGILLVHAVGHRREIYRKR